MYSQKAGTVTVVFSANTRWCKNVVLVLAHCPRRRSWNINTTLFRRRHVFAGLARRPRLSQWNPDIRMLCIFKYIFWAVFCEIITLWAQITIIHIIVPNRFIIPSSNSILSYLHLCSQQELQILYVKLNNIVIDFHLLDDVNVSYFFYYRSYCSKGYYNFCHHVVYCAIPNQWQKSNWMLMVCTIMWWQRSNHLKKSLNWYSYVNLQTLFNL